MSARFSVPAIALACGLAISAHPASAMQEPGSGAANTPASIIVFDQQLDLVEHVVLLLNVIVQQRRFQQQRRDRRSGSANGLAVRRSRSGACGKAPVRGADDRST